MSPKRRTLLSLVFASIQLINLFIFYIGEIKQSLKDRFNEHRRTLDNANTKSKFTTVAEHFLSSPHNISKDMKLIPIENFFSSRDWIRKAREAFFNFKRQDN